MLKLEIEMSDADERREKPRVVAIYQHGSERKLSVSDSKTVRYIVDTRPDGQLRTTGMRIEEARAMGGKTTFRLLDAGDCEHELAYIQVRVRSDLDQEEINNTLMNLARIHLDGAGDE